MKVVKQFRNLGNETATLGAKERVGRTPKHVPYLKVKRYTPPNTGQRMSIVRNVKTFVAIIRSVILESSMSTTYPIVHPVSMNSWAKNK